MDSDADRRASLEALGGSWWYISERRVMALFEDPTIPVAPGETSVGVRAPQLTCCTSDAVGVVNGTTARRSADVYTVLGASHDGAGMTVLQLERPA